MYLYIRGRGSGCALANLQLPCSRVSSGISDGNGGCERWKIFGKIVLKDGSVPQIQVETTTRRNGRREKEVVQASITGLESAVWFKILILDTICLDLETKCIQWTTCCGRDCTERRQSHQPYARCQHSNEWYIEQNKDSMTVGKDLERGLEIARNILNGNNDNEHQDVLLLLHVYVLPIIRLHAGDRKDVSSALRTQIQVLAELDSAIDKMTNERHDIKKTMKNWRQDICNQLTNDEAIASCNIHFLKLLHKHLQNDLKNAYVELDSCQEKVDQCKGSLLKKRGSQYISDLVEARNARDCVAEYINKALFVMEEVHLILSVTTLPEKNELSHEHAAYMQIQEECKRHSKELHDLQRKKLLATSVREALVSTESDLIQGRETTGIDVSSDGLVRSTDVLGPSKLPDAWQTLPSKVSEALEKNKSLQQLHHDFTNQIVKVCREEMRGQPTIRRLKPKLDVGSSWRKLGKKQSGDTRDGQRVRRSTRHSLKERRPTAHFQAITQALKGDVCLHFEEVVRLLASHLNLPVVFSRSDLWSCYERAFFPGRVSDILKLYVYAYESETKNLQNILPTANLQEMQLDDEWILNILGLYAPVFVVETAEEATENIDSVTQEVIDIETPSETDVLKNRLDPTLGEDVRGRLESGVEIDLPEDRLRRHTSPHHKSEVRQSWRNTQIVDFRWVTVPVDIEDGRDMSLSEPCILKKQTLEKIGDVTDHDVATRHASFPETKLRSQAAWEYYSRQAASLTKETDKLFPLLRKDAGHLEDHIGDDSGVFNDHHDDGQLQKADQNSNNVETVKEPEGSVSKQTELCPAEQRHVIPQVSLTKEIPTEEEKPSLSPNDTLVNDSEIKIMIHGTDGQVKQDRELSRRCHEKPAIADFLERFSQAYHYFRVVLEESVPTSKLQWLLRCLKEVNTVAEKQAGIISCGKQRMLSGDDLLTALILFLIHGDPGEVTAFYPQLKFLEDYLPDFLDKGEVGFAVIQFESAYSYILGVKQDTLSTT